MLRGIPHHRPRGNVGGKKVNRRFCEKNISYVFYIEFNGYSMKAVCYACNLDYTSVHQAH